MIAFINPKADRLGTSNASVFSGATQTGFRAQRVEQTEGDVWCDVEWFNQAILSRVCLARPNSIEASSRADKDKKRLSPGRTFQALPAPDLTQLPANAPAGKEGRHHIRAVCYQG